MSDTGYSFGDNAKLVGAAMLDVLNPSNSLAAFTGADVPGQTTLGAQVAQQQMAEHGDTTGAANAQSWIDAGGGNEVGGIETAAGQTVQQIANDPTKVLTAGLSVVPWWAWALGGLAVLAVAAPYVAPFLRRV